MYILAIDPSIASTAIAIYDTDKQKYILYVHTYKIKKKIDIGVKNIQLIVDPQKKDKSSDDYSRYIAVVKRIYDFITPYLIDNTKVYMEGYAFASKGKTFSIGEFCGLIKYHLYLGGNIPTILPPAKWKKDLGLSGTANKPTVVDYILKNGLKDIHVELLCAYNIQYKHKKASVAWLEDVSDAYAMLKTVLDN